MFGPLLNRGLQIGKRPVPHKPVSQKEKKKAWAPCLSVPESIYGTLTPPPPSGGGGVLEFAPNQRGGRWLLKIRCGSFSCCLPFNCYSSPLVGYLLRSLPVVLRFVFANSLMHNLIDWTSAAGGSAEDCIRSASSKEVN